MNKALEWMIVIALTILIMMHVDWWQFVKPASFLIT